MKIHYLQHAPFEGLGNIQEWITAKGHSCSGTLLYRNEGLPEPDDTDWLIVMGGPMNIYDIDHFPWLVAEKKFIAAVIKKDKPVLGICLGAQLIADVMGAGTTANRYKEIGWFPITRSKELANSRLNEIIPEDLDVFHWHGDTFEIPQNCLPIASSIACRNQGFTLNDRVIGMQFHLDFTADSVIKLVENCGDELVDGPFIQTREFMLSDRDKFAQIRQVMFRILDLQESL